MAQVDEKETPRAWFARTIPASSDVVDDHERRPFASLLELVVDVREGRVAHAVLALLDPDDASRNRRFVVPWGLLSPRETEPGFTLKLGKDHVLTGPSFEAGDQPDLGNPAWLARIDHHYHDLKELATLFSATECEELIQCYETHPESRGVHRDTTFVSSELLPPRFLQRLKAIAQLMAKQSLEIEVAQVVRWETGSEQGGHWDRARDSTALTSITNLNASYAGGRTFVGDSRRSITPAVGKTVFFDGRKCWHGVTPVTSGHRYTLAVWYRVADPA